MSYAVVRYLLPFCLELLLYWTLMRVLPMRSRILFVALEVPVYLVGIITNELHVPHGIRFILGPLLGYVLVPLVLSEGPLHQRVIRIVLVNTAVLVAEMVGPMLYVPISGGEAIPSGLDDSNIVPIVAIYAILTIVAAVLFELVVLVCEHVDRKEDARLEFPVVALMLSVFGIYAYVYTHVLDRNHDTSLPMVGMLFLFCIAGLAFGVALLEVSRRDAAARREEVRRDAALRQVERLRQDVTAEEKRLEATRRLRHDLANQVGVVRSLAARGDAATADRYLSELQRRALIIGKATHE